MIATVVMLYLVIGLMLFKIFENTSKRLVNYRLYNKLPLTIIFSAILFFWLPIVIVIIINNFVGKNRS